MSSLRSLKVQLRRSQRLLSAARLEKKHILGFLLSSKDWSKQVRKSPVPAQDKEAISNSARLRWAIFQTKVFNIVRIADLAARNSRLADDHRYRDLKVSSVHIAFRYRLPAHMFHDS